MFSCHRFHESPKKIDWRRKEVVLKESISQFAVPYSQFFLPSVRCDPFRLPQNATADGSFFDLAFLPQFRRFAA